MRRIFVLCGVVILAQFGFAQTVVTPYNVKDGFPLGVVYYLPEAVIDVHAEAECVVEKPGPFFQYAEMYLAEKNVIVKERKEWRLKNVHIRSRYIPDTDRCFQVGVTKNGIAPFLTLSPSGIIEGVNLSACEEGKARHGGKYGQFPKKNKSKDDLSFDLSVLGEDALMANSIPKMAEMAAKQIYRIRESRSALIAGEMENTPDGEAVKAMLKRMDKMECELVALFVGKRAVDKQKRKFSVNLEEDMENHIVFRMSTLEGLLSSDNLMGSPVYINVKGEYLVQPTMSQKDEKQVKGFYYVVPGRAEVVVTDNADCNVKASLVVPQFGYTSYLPAALTDKDNVSIRFSKDGTIVSVTR